MMEHEQIPGTEVLAEGEEEVLRYLEEAGIPADFAANFLELEGSVGRWPGGTWLDNGQGSTEDLMATVTLDSSGVYRVERGPADLFWDLTNPPDDDDDEVSG
jgi:hypothetical protein